MTCLRRLSPQQRQQQQSVVRCFTSSTVLASDAANKKGSPSAIKPQGIPYDKLTIGVPYERFPLERRVAATPESVARLIQPGFRVQLETGAGLPSNFTDSDYEKAGATIVDNVWTTSDIVLKVRRSGSCRV